MDLTRRLPRILAGVTLGAAALVPVAGLPASGAPSEPWGPGDATTPTTDPCVIDGCGPPPDECDPETMLCEPPPPECDPEVMVCEPPPPECEDEEDCPGDPEDPGDEHPPTTDPEPVDPPVVARPTFTG